jgi:hypothetical protein
MKELFMQMREDDPNEGFEYEDDAYWAEQAKWQELYEKEADEEMSREAKLPVNKVPPCSGHALEQEKEENLPF